jgi:hypothetical protein
MRVEANSKTTETTPLLDEDDKAKEQPLRNDTAPRQQEQQNVSSDRTDEDVQGRVASSHPFPDTVDFGTTGNTSDQHDYNDHLDVHHMNTAPDTHTDTHFDSLHHHHHYHHHHHSSNSSLDASSISLNQTTTLIDNTQLVYMPIRLNCGITVYCSPQVLSTCPMILQSLQADVTRALNVLPPSVHSLLLKDVHIWVNASYSYGSTSDPCVLRHLTTHHHSGWLVDCAKDIPQKAPGIEVYNCWDYQKMRLHWNGCGLLLHEFCHVLHQYCLDGGLENRRVEALYVAAKRSKKYDNVLRRDWAGLLHADGDCDLAYAMVDKKEFFAEVSVAFLCHGYKDLSKKDSSSMVECNPPLLHPDVMDRVLKQHGIQDQPLDNPVDDMSSFSCWSLLQSIIWRRPRAKVRMADPIFAEAARSRCCANVDHCNKFYPFTRGQLQQYDPELFLGIRDVWQEIARWKKSKRGVANQNTACC